MQWLVVGFILWFLLSAVFLFVVGASLWLLRRWTPLKALEGDAWARWTATALILPLFWGMGLTLINLLSAAFCLQRTTPHQCPCSPVHHWCGHTSASLRAGEQWLAIGVFAWLSGIGVLCKLLARRRPIWRRLTPSSKLRRAIAKAAIPNSLTVWEAETDAPAGLVGLRRPFIFVARWLVQQLSLPALTTVLQHEYAHWRRKDHWLRSLLFVVSLAFAFVPFVLWLQREWRQASEEAADDWAAPNEATALALAQALSAVRQKTAPLGLGLDNGHLERRIARLQQRRTANTTANWLGGVALLSGLTVATLFSFAPPLWSSLHCLAETLL